MLNLVDTSILGFRGKHLLLGRICAVTNMVINFSNAAYVLFQGDEHDIHTAQEKAVMSLLLINSKVVSASSFIKKEVLERQMDKSGNTVAALGGFYH